MAVTENGHAGNSAPAINFLIGSWSKTPQENKNARKKVHLLVEVKQKLLDFLS